MPTYEYECQKCGHVFEAFQSMTAAPLRSCPECKGKVKRLLGTGAGVVFKGSGFYETDYKRKATSTASTAAGGESAKSASGTKSDSSSADTSTKSAPATPAKPAAK